VAQVRILPGAHLLTSHNTPLTRHFAAKIHRRQSGQVQPKPAVTGCPCRIRAQVSAQPGSRAPPPRADGVHHLVHRDHVAKTRASGKLPYIHQVPYRGSRTKNTGAWLLPEDEMTFDHALRQHLPLPDSAWRCSHPGPIGLHPIHMHASLGQAMQCGTTQAFLHLPLGAGLPPAVTVADGVPEPNGPPPRAIVQYLRGRQLSDDQGTHLRAGRLAVSWYEDEVGHQIHQLLTEQTRQIWSCLTAATLPAHVADTDGRRLTGFRIGPAARDAVQQTGIALSRDRQLFHLV
jgi:hypothetical protein